VNRAGAWTLAGVLAAGLAAAGVLFAVVFAPAEPRDLREPTGPAAQDRPGASAGPAGQAQPSGEVTEAFRAFANEGEPFPPEWLVRTKRVFWADGGALWAEATMPRAAAERVRTIEQICVALSEYVTDRLRLEWHGVSVRTADGQELLTRANTTDSCRPAA
jgi:hypothetical protein